MNVPLHPADRRLELEMELAWARSRGPRRDQSARAGERPRQHSILRMPGLVARVTARARKRRHTRLPGKPTRINKGSAEVWRSSSTQMPIPMARLPSRCIAGWSSARLPGGSVVGGDESARAARRGGTTDRHYFRMLLSDVNEYYSRT